MDEATAFGYGAGTLENAMNLMSLIRPSPLEKCANVAVVPCLPVVRGNEASRPLLHFLIPSLSQAFGRTVQEAADLHCGFFGERQLYG